MNEKERKRIMKADRIMATMKKAHEDGNEIDYNWLISTICLEFGSGHRYIKEIIKDLHNTKKLLIKDGKVYLR